MQGHEAVQTIRDAARVYERSLDPTRRKQLGQYFSGVHLGKLLAHLCMGSGIRTVLDPMAGHGDLLDAVWEAAAERGMTLERIDGVEIDEATATACRDRLTSILCRSAASKATILAANAFDLTTLSALPEHSYDLVITNPPYVRYQRRNGPSGRPDPVRSGLEKIIENNSIGLRRAIWSKLTQGYSGLADLSVPAWILAGFMVRPGGRLALVVPATWRSRNYADVVRYLLLRCFALEIIVADTQPGWFSDALVRTHLIVARRLSDDEARRRLGEEEHWPPTPWLHVSPVAANDSSLVGAAFPGEQPEAAFRAWLDEAPVSAPSGIEVHNFELRREWLTLRSRIVRHRWYPALEGRCRDLPLFSSSTKSVPFVLPDALRQILPAGVQPAELVTLEEFGIRVGQGLRTGCNGFFYVTACGDGDDRQIAVKASPALEGRAFGVPASALRPVLHRQSELAQIGCGELPSSRVLCLRDWILPEDARHVDGASVAYAQRGEIPPQIMPAELATYVRYAASATLDRNGAGRRIPELSAVRTNVRVPRRTGITPRFWYMLPDLTSRHLPAAFVPRISQGTPRAECNTRPPLVIDANFATFWAVDDRWSPFAIKALLNSVWCRAYMEAAGTPLGGGALKLEATHLKGMPLPRLTDDAQSVLQSVGQQLGHGHDALELQAQVNRTVLQAMFPRETSEVALGELAVHMVDRTAALCAARQRRGP